MSKMNTPARGLVSGNEVDAPKGSCQINTTISRNNKVRWRQMLPALFFVSLLAIGCKDDEEVILPTSTLELNISGLEDLGPDYEYEGWMMVNGAPITTGRFSVDAMGNLSRTNFALSGEQLSAATAFILTIEPAIGDDPAPSDVHILAGDFSGNSGAMTTADARAIGTNFASVAGTYIIATPTNDAMDDEYSGVWFLDNSSGTPMAGLSLPQLPAAWVYEGWVVIDGVAVSTGTFSQAMGADSFAGFSGNNGAPPFPGEDFLENAPAGLSFPVDVRGGNVVISVEPVPDNSAAPFLLKPLVHIPALDAGVHSALSMNQNLGSIPVGSFVRK